MIFDGWQRADKNCRPFILTSTPDKRSFLDKVKDTTKRMYCAWDENMPFKEDVTQNIYTSWMQTAGYGPLGYLRRLETFSEEDIQHLIWLLHEELKQKGEER